MLKYSIRGMKLKLSLGRRAKSCALALHGVVTCFLHFREQSTLNLIDVKKRLLRFLLFF